MADGPSIGREATLTWNGEVIGGVQTKTLTLNGEPIDISSDDSLGVRELIENKVGIKSIDFGVDGVTKKKTLMKAWFVNEFTGDLVYTAADGTIISGRFFMATWSSDGPFADAETYQATFQSTGQFSAVFPP